MTTVLWKKSYFSEFQLSVHKVESFNLKTRKHLIPNLSFLGSDRQLISTANLEGESAGDYPDQGSTIPFTSLHSHQ